MIISMMPRHELVHLIIFSIIIFDAYSHIHLRHRLYIAYGFVRPNNDVVKSDEPL